MGKHICLVTPDFPEENFSGGVATHVSHLISFFASRNAEITVIIPDGRTKPRSSLPVSLIRIKGYQNGAIDKEWIINLDQKIREVNKDKKIDFIVSEGYSAYGLPERGVPPIYAFAHNLHFTHFYNRLKSLETLRDFVWYFSIGIFELLFKIIRYEIPFYRAARRTISVLGYNMPILKNIYFVKNAILAENWVDTALCAADATLRKKWRGKFNLPDNAVVFLMTGSDWKPKGSSVLLKAFELCLENEPKCRLMLAGDFDQEKIKKNLNSEKTAEKIIFSGKYTSEILPGILSLADVFVYPGLIREEVPYVMIEALSASLPVLYSDMGGRKKILAGHPFFHRPGDYKKLTCDMLLMASDRLQRIKHGGISKEIAEKRYSTNSRESLLLRIFPLHPDQPMHE